jgi:hypothetical protein
MADEPALLTAGSNSAGAGSVAEIDFARDVRPILSEYCFECHGSDEASREGGLRLDIREAALRGGDSGEPAIRPGNAEESVLLSRILSGDEDTRMPPAEKEKHLSESEIEILRKWIQADVPYARHWAFETPIARSLPAGPHPIDQLVHEQLVARGLQPAVAADSATLCRRLYLDLIGLPPGPAELDAFIADHNADPAAAVVRLIDQLMNMPQFGEKWARHWLDAARYSDSNGFEKDLPREQWAWREWVIQALNKDLPYDQFLIEQLAGDLLPNATQDQIVATGFLRNSMINEEGAIVPEQFRIEEQFDRMDCIGKAVLGLSLQCAQCHSHKFDPITQDEYYGIFAFINDTYEAQSWVYSPEQEQQIAEIHSAIRTAEDELKQQRPAWAEELEAWAMALRDREPEWTALRAVELESTSGLNHPTQQSDLSIMTQGHPTTGGDCYGIFEHDWQGVTGLRLEALTHGDLPFNGPGRSRYGTWAISDLKAEYRTAEGEPWKPLTLVKALADFSEPDRPVEAEWNADFDPEQRRVCGPVSYLIDGDERTGWRADRGLGLRNQPSVAVVQFAEPLQLPAGAQVKLTWVQKHGGNDNGRSNTQLGCCRFSVTTASDPQAQPVDYAAILAAQQPAGQRTDEQQSALFTAWRKSLADAQAINDRIAEQWKKYPRAKTSVLHLAARKPSDHRATPLYERGVWDRPKHEVAPHVPEALHPLDAHEPLPNRLDFARWVASRQSPLTARVAVNRIWQALFGTGLVDTPEDFGTRAPLPVHLAVLDWLAVDFMDHGWSQKHVLRTILTSHTYQQSSRATLDQTERDPGNRFLARGPRFRMEAEVIRDSVLRIAGLLNTDQIGGPSIFPPVPQNVLDFNYVRPTYWNPPLDSTRYRRALYVFRKRSMPDPVLSSFDAPNGDFACARRLRSNTPLTALTGLNEPTFVEAAQGFALRTLREGGQSFDQRAQFAFRWCTAREIRPEELQQLRVLYEHSLQRLARGELPAGQIAFSSLTDPRQLPADSTPNEIAAWAILCRVLMNLDETLTKS